MSSYHFLIVNLAITDLLTCVCAPLIISHLLKPNWELGIFGCKFLFDFSLFVCPMSSCWHLVLLSYARYRSIVQPLKPRISKKTFTFACLVIWLFSFLVVTYSFLNHVYVVERKLNDDGSEIVSTFCVTVDTDIDIATYVYHISQFVLDSILPVVLMMCFYLKISQRLSQDKHSSLVISAMTL